MITDVLSAEFDRFAGLLREGIEATGEVLDVIRGDDRLQFKGMRSREEKGGRCYIGFLSGSDIQEGDLLQGTVSGSKYYVTDVESQILAGKVLQVKAFYETAAQRKAAESREGPIFNIGNAVGSVIGTQTNVNMSIAWRDLENQIEERGGHDQGELRELVGAIRESFEKHGGIQSGSLSRFGDLLKRHAWISSPIAQTLLAFLFGKPS